MTATVPVEQHKANEPRIALVSFDSLGGCLIYLMIADNLQRNGFSVVCYGDIAHQMRNWLPQLDVRPYPAAAQMESELEVYDLAIVNPPSFIRERMDEATTARLREKWLLICQKTPESWHFDHTERIRNEAPAKFQSLKGLLDCSGPIRFKQFTTESVVEIAMLYMRERMHLATVRKTPSLLPPPELRHHRYPRRIIVSPDSADPEKKNWRPTAFLKLCRKLQALGYTPEIIVAPKNHEAWSRMKGNTFNTPRFKDIAALCAYLYESGIVVANDSGNGHLASFLGIPVVTIYRKRNSFFHWRPDWEPGIVVCPSFSLPWKKETLWKHCISVSRVISAIESLLTRNSS